MGDPLQPGDRNRRHRAAPANVHQCPEQAERSGGDGRVESLQQVAETEGDEDSEESPLVVDLDLPDGAAYSAYLRQRLA